MFEVEAWINELQKLIDNEKWVELELLNTRLKQFLINQPNPARMVDFYHQALKQVANSNEYQSVITKQWDIFNSQLESAFTKVLSKNTDDIKGIYCEYFFDGGDSCHLNLYLSEKCPVEAPQSWGAYFGNDGVIEGPDVGSIMNFDPYFEFSPISKIIATEYIESIFITKIKGVLNKLQVSNLPVGFSKHDGVTVIIYSGSSMNNLGHTSIEI